MLNFVSMETRLKNGVTEVYPSFSFDEKADDLMIRGHEFYAFWIEDEKRWSKSERELVTIIDRQIKCTADKLKELGNMSVRPMYMHNDDSGVMYKWTKFKKVIPDSWVDLDAKMIFANQEIKKEDYATFKMPYPLIDSPHPAYDRIMSTLYAPEEREKIEWAIGSIIKGESVNIQKFFVFYGQPGTGKSTILNIIDDLFHGHVANFDSRELAGSNNQFSMESFKSNPLVAIQQDGDLSRIEDNTKINSIVSHERMVVNEKFVKPYEMTIRSMLFMGTNKPVKITDAKAGIVRRLITIVPTGNTLDPNEYTKLMEDVKYEYAGIAKHCLDVYERCGKWYYNNYVSTDMIQRTNTFYNFIEDNVDLFTDKQFEEDGLPLKVAWLRYKEYSEYTSMKYPMDMHAFRNELKSYFKEYKDRYNGVRSVYFGFKDQMFQYHSVNTKQTNAQKMSWLDMNQTESIFENEYGLCQAQYATDEGSPRKSWDQVTSALHEIRTDKLHYVRPPENMIVLDFDLKNEKGEKDTAKNLEAASKFPPTYAEVSKGGGLHLHYIYDGDVSQLKNLVDTDIEIKTFTGKSSLRRLFTVCNGLLIAHISSGLPTKGAKKVIPQMQLANEKSIRIMIKKNLRKEIHPNTMPSMSFIKKILDDAYYSGVPYDVRDMRPMIQTFASRSSHQAEKCLRMINEMHFCSEQDETESGGYTDEDAPTVFFDIEVFPNLFVVCWKRAGKGQKIVRMINPKASEIEELFKMKLIGYNNRRYDNHILYAASMGYNIAQLFDLSQRIINEGVLHAGFQEAYKLSYTDVYDFLSASNKKSLKKWEIDLHIHHQENAHPWDEPVPEEKWNEIADYCCNDVEATEEVFNDKNVQADWIAREILADLSGLTVNDTTNAHTTRIIVGNDPNPQSSYIYTDLSTIFPGYEFNQYGLDKSKFTVLRPDKKGNMAPNIKQGKSCYRGEDPGEGGYVYAEPGIYYNVALLDIASMHPHSAIRLKIFGEEYTMRFADIVQARIYIKHKDYDKARTFLDGKLAKYLNDPKMAKELANGLKTAINSVYGLTSASFANKLKDPRNVDNIVAKYGALFMINLKHEVQDRGYTVVHIKTDSIKIANADDEIIQFVMDYGKEYGYTFEHEDTYERMCIVNDAVYIAKYAKPWTDDDGVLHEWTATGTQFQVPYVFKKLFSGEKIDFYDLCETKSSNTALYLDFNEDLENDDHDYRFIGKIGSFVPVRPGVGGGILLRKTNDGGFGAVNNTKYMEADGRTVGVYRWMEAESVKTLGYEDLIDYRYYDHFVDEAIEAIKQYGDFEAFRGNADWVNVPDGVPDEVEFAA